MTTKEVARMLGVSPQQVRRLIAGGLLEATKPGRDYDISESALIAYKRIRRKPGRPRKKEVG